MLDRARLAKTVWTETLEDRVARGGPLPAAEVARMLARVARELGRAHVQKRGHGAIGPEAVLFVRRPRARCARICLRWPHGDAHVHARAGVLAWRAPEAVTAARATPPGDVWALGLLAFHALVGRPYFREADTVALLREVLVSPLPAASERAGERRDRLPEGFDAWFRRCVARAPGERLATARQAALAFLALARKRDLVRAA